jgi:hypothetical protein
MVKKREYKVSEIQPFTIGFKGGDEVEFIEEELSEESEE